MISEVNVGHFLVKFKSFLIEFAPFLSSLNET